MSKEITIFTKNNLRNFQVFIQQIALAKMLIPKRAVITSNYPIIMNKHLKSLDFFPQTNSDFQMLGPLNNRDLPEAGL